MNMSNTTIYFFDAENGVYKHSSKALPLPNSNDPQVPSDATELEPKLNNSPFEHSDEYESKLKSLDWRMANKVDRWIWDNYMAIEGHWDQAYYIPEPSYKIDKDGYFLNDLNEGGCFDKVPDLPFKEPNKDLKLAKWNKTKSEWEEANKKVTVLDNDGFVTTKDIDLSDIYFTDQKWVDINPDDKLLKPKYDKDKKTFIEAKDIEELRKERLNALKDKQISLSNELQLASQRVIAIREHNNLVDELKLDKSKKKDIDSNMLKQSFEEIKQKLDLDEKADKLKKSLLRAKKLNTLAKINISI